MDWEKESIWAYGQRDPVVEYKLLSENLWKCWNNKGTNNFILFKVIIKSPEEELKSKRRTTAKVNYNTEWWRRDNNQLRTSEKVEEMILVLVVKNIKTARRV